MTEREKMLQSMLYNSRDPELLEMYFYARKWMSKLNQLSADQIEQKTDCLTHLLKEVGERVWVESPFYVDYGQFISIGKDSFINTGCMFMDNNYITIGSNALIGPGVHIYTAEHPIHSAERIISNDDGSTSYKTSSRPVRIGDNVWIGGSAIIMPGVVIGNNVTIAAGSVVTKNVDDNLVVVGNPARILKDMN